ncbi:UvrD-helicase domain-containing protein [Brachybacterium epidermidis]|uniref:UvrD-helicase domain-containing protein n=1 Tax=Brachybacterium epidermidis TaxID=2781983 RepID=UPI00398E9857
MTFTLINASAGSGKTHTLTHDIAERIKGGLQPSQLIATTFTTKAAAELSDRVRRTLLEVGDAQAATGIDSAMIGTVNAVAGQLLREFAMDAGISPDVQVLDADRQKAAFNAAIDDAAAAAGARSGDLLARTGHDGEEDPALPYSATPSWRSHVRELAGRARTNRIGADQLRAAAAASWQEYRDAALPAASDQDRRQAWLAGLDGALQALRAEADAAAESPAATIRKHLDPLEQLRRDLADPSRAPWAGWAKLAKPAQVAEARAAAKEAGRKLPGFAYAKAVDAALLGISQQVADELLANPVLQADARELIHLVMDTAAGSLDAYAQYKDDLGLIDFVDQEVRTLELIRSSPRAQQAVKDRFRLLAVDEFQDTSPVQLELFLELGRLIEDKIWVGDPKQAIYGFRDADPSLMLDVLALLEAGTTEWGKGEITDLTHSWRSQEPVLDLVNAIFPRIFPHMPIERVTLAAAEEAVARRRAQGHPPGRLEAWIPEYTGRKPFAQHATAVADGIMQLLAEPGVGPSDIAVLVRKNHQAEQVIEALTARGIPASGEGASILATREGRILRAALAVTLDLSDTLALTELVDLLPDHRAHRDWFTQLTAAPDAQARQEVFQQWWRDPSLARLHALREGCILLTPVEMIAALADALDLPELIRTWSLPDQRLRTLDAVRALAAEYADQARMDSRPITLTGLRAALDESDRGPNLTGTPDTVWVGTVHGAKGLEWSRVVVMLEAKPTERTHTWGSFIAPAPQLDVTAPLAGRSARYWPKLLDSYPPVQEGLEASAHAQHRLRQDRNEAGRLQYVAFTRSADVTVLSGEGSAPALDALVADDDTGTTGAGVDGSTATAVDGAAGPGPLLSWSLGQSFLQVAGAEQLPAVVRSTRGTLPEDAEAYGSARSPLAATDLPDTHPSLTGTDVAPSIAPARSVRFQASGVASSAELGTVGAPQRIGTPLVSQGAAGWERVGEAVHAYLSLPLDSLTPEQRTQAAQRLVERWAVTRSVGSDALMRAGEAWSAFLEEWFPGAQQLTEQPITWWNQDDQVMEGWIDTLLRLPDGRIVLVDHKTYPGAEPVRHVREHYLGQLDTYSQALAAAGIPPAQVLIHLPLRGEVLEVDLEVNRAR